MAIHLTAYSSSARRFYVGFAWAVVLLLGATSSSIAPQVLAVNVTDVDILNFALNLEYLEAEFYSYAAYGHGIDTALRGGGPKSIGGRKALLSPEAQEYAENIAIHEINHVKFLRAALGDKAVKMPLVDIGPAFAAAANAAVGTTLRIPFSPYSSDILFYHGAFIFEDVGVTAYKGAAPFISNKAYLEAAAGILAVEAYHAGAIRAILSYSKDEFVFPYGAQVKTIINAISALRAKASGKRDDIGLVVRGKVQLAAVDSNSIAFSRTTDQVLHIVYLGQKPGGFFPKGLNGKIK